MKENTNKYNVKSVEKVLNILRLFKDYNSTGLTLTDISNISGLDKSTALRLVSTLKYNDYLRYNEETKKYSLGLMMITLGNSAIESLDLRKFAREYLIEASNITGLIAHLGILDREQVIIIEKIWPDEKRNFIKMVSEIGGIVPAYCTGVGKVLLSGKSDEYIKQIFENSTFKVYSEYTAKNIHELLERIQEIRRNGYAVNFGEHEPYIKCITYPVFDVKGNIAAAVSLTGLIDEYNSIDELKIHQVLKNTTLKISQQLGYLSN